MHGGLSPDLKNVYQVFGSIVFSFKQNPSYAQLNQLERPCEVPEHGLLCDILWADPDEDVVGERKV